VTHPHAGATAITVETFDGGVVSDSEDCLPDKVHHIGESFGSHLSGNMDLTGGEHRFHRYPTARVLPQQVIKDGIADLIGHLVWMALCYRFGGKKAVRHNTP